MMKDPSNTHGGTQLSLFPTEPDPKASLDMISVLGHPLEDFFGWADERSSNHSSMFVKGEIPAKDRTTSATRLPEYGHFATRKGGELVLYTFNPNTVPEWAIAEALSHLTPERITRVDVSLDYFFDFSDFRFGFPRRTQQKFVNAAGEDMSMAFGKRSSGRYIRVYDRNRQQGVRS